MNVQLLIDGVVRQTTILIAELATVGGARAPLAHVATQVFLDLAAELERQGVSRRVSADMFGIALRSYQRKIARLRESATERGRTLWEAVYDYLGERGVATRAQIQQRFDRDDAELVGGVLRDLAESGLVFASGRGATTAYRVVTRDELDRLAPSDEEGIDAMVWTVVYREGPLARAQIGELVAARSDLDAALQRLVEAGRVTESTSGGVTTYASSELFIAAGAQIGWEAAVLDHFQAVVRTVVARLRMPQGEARDLTGGSTYTLIVWPGHPYYEEASTELGSFRARRSALRTKVDAYNAEHGIAAEHVKLVSYCGQYALVEQGTENDDEK
jgi:hypothetical protein